MRTCAFVHHRLKSIVCKLWSYVCCGWFCLKAIMHRLIGAYTVVDSDAPLLAVDGDDHESASVSLSYCTLSRSGWR